MDTTNRDDLGERLQRLPAEIRRLVEKRIELMGFELAEEFSGMFAMIFYRLQGMAIFGAGCLLLVVALAFYLGELLGSTSIGFVLASIPVLIIGLIFILMKPRAWVRMTRDRIFEMMMEMVIQITGPKKKSTPEPRSNGEK